MPRVTGWPTPMGLPNARATRRTRMASLSPVLEGGAPAPDGTGPFNDGILKAEDVLELDWQWDRKQTESGALYFAHPYADLWRETLVSHLVRTAVEHGLTIPLIAHTPAD